MDDYPGKPLAPLRNYFFDEIEQRIENKKTPYQIIIVAGNQRHNFADSEKAAKFLGVSSQCIRRAKSSGYKCKGFKII